MNHQKMHDMNLKVIFNPFEKIAGTKSLFFGLAAVLVTGTIGYFSKTHFDGILNIHSGMQLAWYVHVAAPILSVAVIAIWFWLFVVIFGKQNVRVIDVVGTQFFAFIPLVPASVLGFFEVTVVVAEALQKFGANPAGALDIAASQMLVFVVLMIILMLLTVWSAIWIYKGYKVAANLPNHIHIPVYITGIIVGMIVPKLLIPLII
ncbi:MAG: hypothetical protein JXA77_06965 [Bacteroidales bacterium]|nr:hypothetical protein [Bacteroidales bacterium]MBN2819877.1 hypothetical protein [Bacteroidales bacterium]